MTEDLITLRDLMESEGVEECAMESTSVYWIPIWRVLVSCVKLHLVNPYFIKQCPSETSDVNASKIVQTLQIGQYGHAQYLEVTPDVLNSSKYDKCYDIKMKSDGIKPSFSCSSFLSISHLTKDGFTITVYPNYNPESRTGIVIVEEDDVQAVINIYQEEGYEEPK